MLEFPGIEIRTHCCIKLRGSQRLTQVFEGSGGFFVDDRAVIDATEFIRMALHGLIVTHAGAQQVSQCIAALICATHQIKPLHDGSCLFNHAREPNRIAILLHEITGLVE